MGWNLFSFLPRQSVNLRINYLANISYDFFFNWQAVLDRQEIYFAFQLLKLENIRGQNWRIKLMKTSDDFATHFKI